MSPGAVQFVLVCAAASARMPDVDAALASCALTSRRIDDDAALLAERTSDDCGLALLALPSRLKDDSNALDMLSHLKERGYTVFCFAPSAAAWPLAVRCRLLLAGAAHVFDTTMAAFATELRERITCHLKAGRTSQRDEQPLLQTMRELGLIGTSPGIVAVFRSILRVSAMSNSPVLITGETGTGKELVARSIHRLDPQRCHEPFIPVNCSAITAGLAESQLFGHRRGAFTGADHARAGLIRAARGGVLFLDEIGDLDPGLQGKLLRVLQEHRVLGLGEDHEVPVAARIIAATNRNLEAMVRDGTFRSDLFHRLNVLSLHLPPLRERPDDIDPLVQHVLARDAGTLPPVRVTPDFVQALRNVDLPGNVRELENLVAGAVVTRINGEPLGLDSLPPKLWLQIAGLSAPEAQTQVAKTPDPSDEVGPPAVRSTPVIDAASILKAGRGSLNGALKLCEREILSAALKLSAGNRSRAARLLGISARSIFSKLRKHGLTR